MRLTQRVLYEVVDGGTTMLIWSAIGLICLVASSALFFLELLDAEYFPESWTSLPVFLWVGVTAVVLGFSLLVEGGVAFWRWLWRKRLL